MGLGYDKKITVRIHNVSKSFSPPKNGVLGFVTTYDGEGRKVIHLTDDNRKSWAKIKGTAAHEYLHNAQGHSNTKVVDDVRPRRLIIDDKSDIRQWLTEGTARWFEDKVFDSLNPWTLTGPRGFRMMEVGVNSVKGDERQSPYGRFSFFKLMSQSCNRFDGQLRNLFNPDGSKDPTTGKYVDPTGIKNLADLLDDADCNFGDHLGRARHDKLEAAIAYFNYATQFKLLPPFGPTPPSSLTPPPDATRRMSLLDSNEPSVSTSWFDEPDYQFMLPVPGSHPDPVRRGVTYVPLDQMNFSSGTFVLKDVWSIPAAGAYSFKIPRIDAPLPVGKVAELTVWSNREVIVSMTGDDGYFIGAKADFPVGPDGDNNFPIGPAWDDGIRNHHTWFSTTDHGSSYGYEDTTCGTAGDCLPEIFVTVVNPSLEDRAMVTVSWRVRDETTVEPVITSHAHEDSVSNRVVRIVGSIPAEARDETDKVVVTTNGIRTETTLNRDGSFAADVVVSFGKNTITAQGFKAQGFNANSPTTNEEGITIKGVRSSSTGRNALIPSRIVFVLRWNTNGTDIDIYATDKNGGTIWFADRREGPGNLDYDDTNGFGPEVVSYRETGDDVYVNGTFDVDVHYYRGSPDTDYTLDVIVNEEGAGIRRSYKYRSKTPLTVSNSRQAGPGGSGSSRFNGVLSVSCNAGRICQVSGYDSSKLSIAGATSAAPGPRPTGEGPAGAAEPRYEQCMSESVDWSCNPDGTKQWP